MIGKTLLVATALLLAGTSGHAQTVKGQAESWGLQNEELAVLEGKVVDILCEVAGDCPQNCGGGARQLGILSSQGKLTPVSKNGQTAFTGAIVDLLPLCNKTVELDGLFAGDGKRKLFLTQFLREKGAANWIKADAWTREWKARNPQAKGDPEEWYYQDPRIRREIEANGHLGLGAEADKAYVKSAF